jgi:hypothetical protein
VGGEPGEVSITRSDPISTTPTATAIPLSTTSESSILSATGINRSVAPMKGSFV